MIVAPEAIGPGVFVLRNGQGPAMEVKYVDEGLAYCKWREHGRVHGMSYPVETLRVVQP